MALPALWHLVVAAALVVACYRLGPRLYRHAQRALAEHRQRMAASMSSPKNLEHFELRTATRPNWSPRNWALRRREGSAPMFSIGRRNSGPYTRVSTCEEDSGAQGA